MVLGTLLVMLGLLFFVAQFFDVNLGRLAWPLFVIVPGIFLLVMGLVVRGSAGEPLVILGSMTTATGAILAYQNATGLWATWAYAWALITPTAIGLGKLAYSGVVARSDMARDGLRMTVVGLAIFLVAGAFFEGVVGLSGFGIRHLGGYVFPALLIGLGVILLFTNLFSGRRQPRDRYYYPEREAPREEYRGETIVEPAAEVEPAPPVTSGEETTAQAEDDSTLEIRRPHGENHE